MKKTFYFVRHGETEWNKVGRIQGSTDIPLSDTGILQAEELAKHLSNVSVSYVYSSPLKRANMTADIIAKAIGVDVKVNTLLREICFGDVEGKIYSELPQDAKKLLDAIFSGGNDVGSGKLPNAESFDDVFSRFMKFMDDVPEEEDNILIVSHGGFIKIALLKFLSEQIRIGNCACFSFEYDKETKNITNLKCI
ncbi:MAG: histidine phosphatase family protein [bacterium]|nr:histidine phosphatase family protein [bacterium]